MELAPGEKEDFRGVDPSKKFLYIVEKAHEDWPVQLFESFEVHTAKLFFRAVLKIGPRFVLHGQ